MPTRTRALGSRDLARRNSAVMHRVAHASSGKGVTTMLGWALVFFVLALVCGFLGFVALAGLAAGIAKILFLIFLALLVIGFAARAIRGQSVL